MWFSRHLSVSFAALFWTVGCVKVKYRLLSVKIQGPGPWLTRLSRDRRFVSSAGQQLCRALSVRPVLSFTFGMLL